MIQHRSPISGIDSMDGVHVVTAGYDNQLILWDIQSKRGITRSCHDHLANQCRISPDGTLLVSASSDHTARVWKLPSMQLLAVLTGHEDDIEMAAFSPDAKRVATASRDNTIGIFSVSGKLEHRLQGHRADVISVEWTGDGCQILSSGDDGSVRRWCTKTGSLLETTELEGVETDTIAVTEDGQVFAGNDEGNIVSIKGSEISHVAAHRAGIKKLVYHRQHHLLLSASYDRTIKVWAVSDSGGLTNLFEAPVPDIVWLRSCCFVSVDQLAFGTFGSSFATFSMRERAWDLTNVGDTSGLNAVRVTPDGQYTVGDAGTVFLDGLEISHLRTLCNFIGTVGFTIVTGGQSGKLFDAKSGRHLYTHHSPLNCSVSFVRHGIPHIVVGTYTGEALVFSEGAGGVEHVLTFPMHNNAIKGVACNGEHIFSVCASGAVAFHSVATFDCARTIFSAHRKISNGAASLADGRFVSVSRDLSLRIWTFSEVEEFSTPFTHSIKCVAASESGSLIAAGSYDGHIGLFDWVNKVWVSVLRPTASGISSICATDSQDEFRATSYDGVVYTIVRGQGWA